MSTATDALRNSQADDLVGNLDTLDVLDGSGTVLVSYSLTWDAAAAGETSVSGLPIIEQASNGGDAAEARLTGSTSEEITGLTVGESGAQVVIDNATVTSSQDVELQSLSYTAPTDPIA